MHIFSKSCFSLDHFANTRKYPTAISICVETREKVKFGDEGVSEWEVSKMTPRFLTWIETKEADNLNRPITRS